MLQMLVIAEEALDLIDHFLYFEAVVPTGLLSGVWYCEIIIVQVQMSN